MKGPTLLLTMTLFTFGAAAWASDYRPEVKTREVVSSATTVTGRPIVYPKGGTPQVTAMTVEIPPGGETGWHTHPVPVYAWVLSGTLSVEFEGGKKLQFKEGDAIIEAVNAPQNGRNNGSEPVKLLVFTTGVQGVPNVVKSVVYDTETAAPAPAPKETPAAGKEGQAAAAGSAAAPAEKSDNSLHIKLRYNAPVIE